MNTTKGDETPKSSPDEVEETNEIIKEETVKPLKVITNPSSQNSASLTVLKQQIQITNLTEEIEELKATNRELQKEVQGKTQEIYDVKDYQIFT